MNIEEIRKTRAQLFAGMDALLPAERKGALIMIEETYALEKEYLANAMIQLGMTGNAIRARAQASISHAKFDALMRKAAMK